MIIFNAGAIIVLLLAALLSLPFYGIYYFGGMGEDMLAIFVSWMVMVASFIVREGRLFFIPMWILSIPLPFVVTYMAYGWTGIGVTFGLFIGFVALIIGFAYMSEKKRLKNLRSEKIEFPDREEDAEAYWIAVKDKFFFPSYVKMTPEIARFNIRVAEALEKQETELTTLEAFKTEMGKAGSKRKKIDPTAQKNLTEELDQKLLELQEAKELLEKVSG